jgi:hypothetical protein
MSSYSFMDPYNLNTSSPFIPVRGVGNLGASPMTSWGIQGASGQLFDQSTLTIPTGLKGATASPVGSSIPSWASGDGGQALMPEAYDGWKAFQRAVLGGRDQKGNQEMGFGGLAIGGISALGNLYMGMKQYGLAKDQLNFQKSSFERNWEASKSTTNSALEDRQKARVASNPGAYESVGSYMGKYGIK